MLLASEAWFNPRPEQKLEPTTTVLQSGDPAVIFTNHTQCPSPSSLSSTGTILLLHTPLKHLITSRPLRAPCSAASMLGGIPVENPAHHSICHYCHFGVVVKCSAFGQCGPGSIPGRCRSWSRHLQSSKVHPLHLLNILHPPHLQPLITCILLISSLARLR